MNILICPDKFKGSLDAKEVCHAVKQGLLQIDANFQILTVPLADGGEGTCDLLMTYHEGSRIELDVKGPLFSPVRAHYGLSKDGREAYVEMAAASGLMLLEPQDRNPLLTTSFGTGQLIEDAIRRGAKTVVLGIGGSATNDAGMGMAAALGYEFFDSDDQLLKPTGENLIHIHHIRTTGVNPSLLQTEVIALCDVTNPLFGQDGAAYVYGPQKGARESDLALLDAGLRNFRRVAHKQFNTSVDFPGAGAAGGLGAGARVFLHAAIEKGVNFIIRTTRLEEKVKDADVIITGEGKIDLQTFSGKVVSEVIRLAQKAGKPVLAVCGRSEISKKEMASYGLHRVVSLVDDETSPESAILYAAELLTRKTAEQLIDIRKL